MPRMYRATIEEAARSLGVTQSVVESQIKSGSLVPCQDPSFRRCVWISESARPKPKRKARAKLKQDGVSLDLARPVEEIGSLRDAIGKPEADLEIGASKVDPKARDAPEERTRNNGVDLAAQGEPANLTGLLQKTVDLLNTELEITAPKLRRKAKDIPPKETRNIGVDLFGPVNSSEETGMLRETIAMLKAELEIRDEQLDLLGMQLELSRQAVRKLRPLLGVQLELRSKEVQNLHFLLDSIPSPEQGHKAGLHEPLPPLPAVAVAVRSADDETPGAVAGFPVPVPPTQGARPGYPERLRRSFRPFFGLTPLGFIPPLFH